MKTVKNLINAEGNKKLGNHRVEREGNTTKYIYYYTAICIVNEKEKTFITDNGGYRTVSTTRAINSYKRQLSMLGYTEQQKQVKTLVPIVSNKPVKETKERMTA